MNHLKEFTIARSFKLKTKIDVPLAALMSIVLFLAFHTNDFVWWIGASVCFVGLVNKPHLVLASLVIVIVSLLVVKYAINTISLVSTINGNFKVTDTNSMGFIITNDNGQRILVKSHEQTNFLDLVHVEGRVEKVVNNSDFDLKQYLSTIKVFSIIKYSKVSVISNSQDVRNLSLNYLTSGSDSFKSVASLVLLGKKTVFSKGIYEMTMKMNIIHLFVISGLHISLLFLVFDKILRLVKVPELYSPWVSLVPIWIYIYLLNFPISALRAATFISFVVINKTVLKQRFTSLEIFGFVMSLMFLINPYSVMSLSFIFSYIATFVVLFTNTIKWRSDFIKWIMICLMGYASNLLIIMSTNHYFTLFGLFFGIALAPLFTITYLISIFLFWWKDGLTEVYKVFLYVIKAVDSINILVDVPNIPKVFVKLSYELVLACLIINKIWNISTELKTTSLIES